MNKSSKNGMSIEDQESLNKMKNSVRLVNRHCSFGMLWKRPLAARQQTNG